MQRKPSEDQISTEHQPLAPSQTAMSAAISKFYLRRIDTFLKSLDLDPEEYSQEYVDTVRTRVLSKVLGLGLPPFSIEQRLKNELQVEFSKRGQGTSQLEEQNTVEYAQRINELKDYLKTSQELRNALKSMIDDVVRLEALPEFIVTLMYPEGASFGPFKVEAHELISLLTVAILWTLQESGEYTPLEAAIIYQALFLRKSPTEINESLQIENAEEQYRELSQRISNCVSRFSDEATIVENAASNRKIFGDQHPIYHTMDRIPLETPNRIRNLIVARTIEIPENDPVKRTSEYMLLSRLRNGDLLARNKFTVAMTRLAGFMANSAYARRIIGLHELSPSAHEDFQQECLEFVLRKAHNYDPVQFAKSGTSFFINNFKQLIGRLAMRMSDKLDAPVYIEELCRVIRLMYAQGKDTETIIRELTQTGKTKQLVENALFYMNGVVSLDAELNEDGLTRYDLNITADTNHSANESNHIDEHVGIALRELGESSFGAYVLYLRNAEHMTLQEVADKFGYTRERVRQIQDKYLERIMKPRLEGKSRLVVLDEELLRQILREELPDEDLQIIFLKKTGLHCESHGKGFRLDNQHIYGDLPIDQYTSTINKSRETVILDRLKLNGAIAKSNDREAIIKFRKALEELT